MSLIKPFRSLRPSVEAAARVASVPYDVVNCSEVIELTRENRDSFLRVTRPECEIAGDEKPLDKARLILNELIANNVLEQDLEPALYLYRLADDSHSQTGLVACCSLDEYENGLIKKHEKTRPDKVKDRTDHIVALRAQTGLIFLAYRGTDAIGTLTSGALTKDPLYDLIAADGIRHTVWRITDTEPWTAAFAAVPALYVADGHHRIESAFQARKVITDSDEANYVIAGVFPAEELNILAYNRAVKDLNGLSENEFLNSLKDIFVVTEAEYKEPRNRSEFCMYLGGKWYRLLFNRSWLRDPGPIEKLDVKILQDNLLSPILGIGDPRTDERISFIGGARGTAELERLVNKGEAAVAFSMFPTTMDDLLAVSDAGEIMPPKSTWFEPKLRDGLLVHCI